MQTKYTNDGKKVGIVGKLNAEQTIVQEIFITESGQEIPSGENFVVTSLHDQPVKKWSTFYEDQCKRAEKEYEYKLKRIEENNSRLYKQLERYKESIDRLRDKSPDDFAGFLEQASNLFDPKNKWVVVKDYSRWYVSEFSSLFHGDYKLSVKFYLTGFEAKLYITTKDDNFKDFSVFETKEAATNYVKERISSLERITEEDIKISEALGFTIPSVLLDDLKARRLEEKQKQLKEAMDMVAAIEKEIQEKFA